MTSTLTMSRSAQPASANLPTFDLTLVRNHIAREHTELDAQTVHRAEYEYRKFLLECKKSSGRHIVPGRLVDEFWHAHILHTKLYAEDCMTYFGYFLHHAPKVMDAKLVGDLTDPGAVAACSCNNE
jgi:hypothetical protein